MSLSLTQEWTMYVDDGNFHGKTDKEFVAGLTKVANSFTTIEHFWKVFNHCDNFVAGAAEANTFNFRLFQTCVQPTYEDPANCHGGKWVITLPDDIKVLRSVFKELAMATVGGGILATGLVLSSKVRKGSRGGKPRRINVLQLWVPAGPADERSGRRVVADLTQQSDKVEVKFAWHQPGNPENVVSTTGALPMVAEEPATPTTVVAEEPATPTPIDEEETKELPDSISESGSFESLTVSPSTSPYESDSDSTSASSEFSHGILDYSPITPNRNITFVPLELGDRATSAPTTPYVPKAAPAYVTMQQARSLPNTPDMSNLAFQNLSRASSHPPMAPMPPMPPPGPPPAEARNMWQDQWRTEQWQGPEIQSWQDTWSSQWQAWEAEKRPSEWINNNVQTAIFSALDAAEAAGGGSSANPIVLHLPLNPALKAMLQEMKNGGNDVPVH